MASKLQDAMDFTGEVDCKVDMAPMIDMVFLLLIFFMVTANWIDQRLNKSVQPPVANQTKPLEKVGQRVLIHVLENGTFMGDSENVLALTDIENLCRREAELATARGTKPILMLRADRRANLEGLKKVIGAAANAGVTNVSFSTQKANIYTD